MPDLRLAAGQTRFKLLQIQDTHYHPGPATYPDGSGCWGVPGPHACSRENTTRFINAAMLAERPDLNVYVGDVIDAQSAPARHSMDTIYTLGTAPFAASLGNHDGEALSRADVMDHIVGLPRSLTRAGPVSNSYGNYYIDVLGPSGRTTLLRCWFFDNRLDGVSETISRAQLDWFTSTSARLPAVPALVFAHIPILELETAAQAGTPASGSMREPIMPQLPNPAAFDTVVGIFHGHDHANDFCVLWAGVHICYGGSAGFTAYGFKHTPRRVRVIEAVTCAGAPLTSGPAPTANAPSDSVCEIWTWKRLAPPDGGRTQGPVDRELLWSARAGPLAATWRRPLPLADLGLYRYRRMPRGGGPSTWQHGTEPPRGDVARLPNGGVRVVRRDECRDHAEIYAEVDAELTPSSRRDHAAGTWQRRARAVLRDRPSRDQGRGHVDRGTVLRRGRVPTVRPAGARIGSNFFDFLRVYSEWAHGSLGRVSGVEEYVSTARRRCTARRLRTRAWPACGRTYARRRTHRRGPHHPYNHIRAMV